MGNFARESNSLTSASGGPRVCPGDLRLRHGDHSACQSEKHRMSDSFGCNPSWSQAIVSGDAPLPTVPVIDLMQAAVVIAPEGSRGELPKQWALDGVGSVYRRLKEHLVSHNHI